MGYIPLRFLYFVCDALIKKRMAEINSERAQLHVFRYNLFRFVGNYSWLLNNKGLNCTHPLRCNVFQQLLRFYMICGWLNPWMQKADCKVPFQLCDGCWSRNLLWSRSTVLVGACMYKHAPFHMLASQSYESAYERLPAWRCCVRPWGNLRKYIGLTVQWVLNN